MKKWILILVAVFFIIGGGTLVALAYGENFSSPLAQYSRVTTWFSGGHTGIDYRILHQDKIVAAKSGVVRESYFGRADFWDWPCDNSWNSRGNYIILDHWSNYSTWYFHLSNAGNTPPRTTSFTRGDYMALGDDTGCSTADHLHFSTKLNDIAFDPYAGNTNWVSGSPIPMGFRDQNNNERGSFNLDNTKIHDKWVGLEGSPGAPTEDDGTYSCPTFGNDPDGALTATLYYQRFQWGEIEYCGTAAATYTAYPRTYLPDVSSAYASNYWGSVVSTHNIYKTSTARTIYFPVMKYRYYEMTTGLTVQNISSGYASYIQMYYFNYDGTPMGCSTTAYNVPPYAHVVFYDGPCLGDNFLGTAIATSNQSIHIAVVVNIVNKATSGDTHAMYNASIR